TTYTIFIHMLVIFLARMQYRSTKKYVHHAIMYKKNLRTARQTCITQSTNGPMELFYILSMETLFFIFCEFTILIVLENCLVYFHDTTDILKPYAVDLYPFIQFIAVIAFFLFLMHTFITGNIEVTRSHVGELPSLSNFLKISTPPWA
ncbi:hypothetical protein ACJX0J_038296, partial [Zea mays]